MHSMDFRIKAAALTDIGAKRRINQDAVLVKVARSDHLGRICFAVVCDGLGGLSQGEIASAAFVRRMEKWFFTDLVDMAGHARGSRLDASQCLHRARLMWQAIIMEMNEEISAYGQNEGIRLGTTTVLFLLIGHHYLVMHVGDSRLYMTKGGQLTQITHDHSLVQKQLDAGILTPAQAAISDQKSVLLQCIGASDVVRPDSKEGTLFQDTSVLLCTDGLWRHLYEEELRAGIRMNDNLTELQMNNILRGFVSDVKHRGERDNISAVYLALFAEAAPQAIPFPNRQVAVC